MLARRAAREFFRSGTSRFLASADGAGASAGSESSAQQTSSKGENTKDPYDVVIVGGGMVGAAVACGLASSALTSSLRIAVIDGSPFPAEKVKKSSVPDARVSSITPATVSFLKDVGAWDEVVENGAAPFNSMQVWDHTKLAYTRYNAADVQEPVLGYVVENRVLVGSLRSRLKESSVHMLCPSQVESVKFPNCVPHEETSNWAEVQLKDGQTLAARLVVGADGGKSKVRKMAGISTIGWPYDQRGLICTVRVERNHSTAWQRFLPEGPLALLPMNDDFSNIVWSTTPESASELQSLSEEGFVDIVNHSLTKRYCEAPRNDTTGRLVERFLSPLLGSVAPSSSEDFELPVRVTGVESERLSFPLSLAHARSYAGKRVALVGDAAHTVHPLAGQGVNLGFGDAAALVQVLAKGVRCGLDVGDATLLSEYETTRKFANLPMMAVLDGFQRVFSSDTVPVQLLRAAGFSLVQTFGPLKKLIISSAMSNGINVPGFSFKGKFAV